MSAKKYLTPVKNVIDIKMFAFFLYRTLSVTRFGVIQKGSFYSVSFPETTKISDLYQRFASDMGIKKEKLLITFNGQVLHRCMTIEESGIKNGSYIKVHQASSSNGLLPKVTSYWSGMYAVAKKPVIYLYPTKSEDVKVSINTQEEFTAVYPSFTHDHEWEVHAEPSGQLTIGGRKYGSLFWEAKFNHFIPSFETGFIVERDDAIKFLEEKLHSIGLNDAEANEFITFWIPVLNKNGRSVVSFQFENYQNHAKLDISPKPDSVLRVFLAIRKAEANETIKEQEIPSFTRNGFTVVEWGGMEI